MASGKGSLEEPELDDFFCDTREGRTHSQPMTLAEEQDLARMQTILFAKRKRGSCMALTISELIDIARPGDVFLFQNPHIWGNIQRTWTSAEYDHVGIAIPTPFDEISELSLLEATTTDNVKRYPLRKRLQEWGMNKNVKIAVRLLTAPRSKQVEEKINDFTRHVNGLRYGIGLKKLLTRKHSVAGKTTYFCSELVAKVLKVAGALTDKLPSNTYLPSHFTSAKHFPLPFSPGCSLSPEIMLDCSKGLNA